MRYSLFIGRYQPLHEGHIKLIRSVLNEGRNATVALRDTPLSDSDPFSIEERMEMFRKEFGPEMDERRVLVMVIPDIEEVVHGRKVGWGIREIKLDEETEAISGTKTREKMRKEGKL
jgi:adenylylsulfate kinase